MAFAQHWQPALFQYWQIKQQKLLNLNRSIPLWEEETLIKVSGATLIAKFMNIILWKHLSNRIAHRSHSSLRISRCFSSFKEYCYMESRRGFYYILFRVVKCCRLGDKEKLKESLTVVYCKQTYGRTSWNIFRQQYIYFHYFMDEKIIVGRFIKFLHSISLE